VLPSGIKRGRGCRKKRGKICGSSLRWNRVWGGGREGKSARLLTGQNRERAHYVLCTQKRRDNREGGGTGGGSSLSSSPLPLSRRDGSKKG